MSTIPRKPSRRDIAEAWSLGLLFPVSIASGFGLGYWLDGLLGTRPWLGAIGTGLGVVAAFLNLIRMGIRSDRSLSDSEDES